MLKNFCFFVITSTVLIPLFPKVGISEPLYISTQYPEVNNANIDTPSCYIQTADGRTINLDNLCKKAPVQTSSNLVTKFGAGNCYLLDANGRPCKVTTPEQNSSSQQKAK